MRHGMAMLTKDERLHLKTLYEKRKTELGDQAAAVVSASITRLATVHGYSQSCIANMLGLSRERVRQIMALAGVPVVRGGYYRMWNPKRSRFVRTAAKKPEHLSAVRKRRKQLMWKGRREESVAKLKEMAAELGRPPELQEFGVRVLPHLADNPRALMPALVSRYALDWRRLGLGYAQCADMLWRMAGMERPEVRFGRNRPDYRPNSAKLTDDEVRQVRDLLAAGRRQAEVAEWYGMNPSSIWAIANGRSFKYVK